ncbi:TPA: helix-turn-helix domain-containing protein [Yersinia enterocolitica]|uniref:helix-turn-helix domain-containing protein n=1 Tax=Yersinia enterocolitica TaxID=630 RepID=UPI0005FD0131|nr:helix-turn-helix transcriptional regulator [Yersinia enterocolitica]EKN5931117.1 transcriptional regulator [Yersinia enterocolitica]CRE40112.1 putative DNA-binding protein [Yersinia enterocolitica]HDL7348070.1 helix-turn-helix domain-containing protein [Yersinia enterocolitica]HDL7807000.1 helix-turn-helix domain-containing protein [Yersinia enterocolitica]
MILRKSDWHPADIIAALRKKDTTLAAVSRKAGLSSSTLANALTRPWPKGERLIAECLEIHPSEIWPTRYFDSKTGVLLDRKVRIRQPITEA